MAYRLQGVNFNHHNSKLAVSLLVLFWALHSGLALRNSFIPKETCICPRQVNETHYLIYECTTVGGVLTIWNGTAFDCLGSLHQITLGHSGFLGMRGTCSNGNIRAVALRVEQEADSPIRSYTSMLNVTYTPALLNATIQCVHNTATLDVIGKSTIALRTEPVPPPDSITLSSITPGPQLTFTWSRAAECRDVSYNIRFTRECGECPTSTKSSTAVCPQIHTPSTGSRTCSFSVTTVACENLVSTEETTLTVNLKAPDPPTVSLVPIYSHDTVELAGIKTDFMESPSFNITDDQDGSATQYIIEYFEASTNTICATQTVLPLESCVNGRCTHFFDVSSSDCDRSGSISVTVSGVNSLGRGASSTPILIREINNNFFDVTIDLMSSVVSCRFLNQQDRTLKTCTIMYNRSESCRVDDTLHLSRFRQISQDTSNTVVIGLPFVNQLGGNRTGTFCFVVSATNATYTAMISGLFNGGCDPNRLYSGPTVLSPTGAVCDPPSSSLGGGGGYACYSGTLVGSYAVHHCFNCDDRLVRVCMGDGNWSGTELQCNCPVGTAQEVDIPVPILLGVFVPVVAILILVAVVLLIAYISVFNKKRETSAEVAALRSRVTELSVVYEEVNPNAAYSELRQSNSPDSMDTYNNRAYKVPRPVIKECLDAEPPHGGEGYEIMRSVSHQKL